MKETIPLIELLIDVKVFPVKLAQKIGLEESVIFHYFLYKYLETEFEFVDTFSSSFGIKDIKKCLANLKTYKLIEESLSGKFKLNLNELEHIFYGKSEERKNVELEKSIQDFMRMRKAKGRLISRSKVLEMIEGKQESNAIKSLKYSTYNKYIKLFWPDENTKGFSKKPQVGKSGGSTNSYQDREYLSEEI